MLTFNEFEKYMNYIKELMQKENKLDEALQEISPDFGGFCTDTPGVLVELLEIIMKDTEQLISYYIWEAEWGKQFNKIWDENNNEIPLNTVQDLYNILLEKKEN